MLLRRDASGPRILTCWPCSSGPVGTPTSAWPAAGLLAVFRRRREVDEVYLASRRATGSPRDPAPARRARASRRMHLDAADVHALPWRSTTWSTMPRRPPTSSAATASRRRWSRPRRSPRACSRRHGAGHGGADEFCATAWTCPTSSRSTGWRTRATSSCARGRSLFAERHRPDDGDPLEGHLRDARGSHRRLRDGRQRARARVSSAAGGLIRDDL